MTSTYLYRVVGFLMVCVSTIPPLQAQSLRVMSIDWTQTETLLALGIPPIAIAQKSGYDAWVKKPPIPSTTVDVGLRSQPNLERLSELKPDRIFISPMFRALTPKLSRIAPVTEITLYRKDNITWDGLKTFTHTLAKELDKQQAAEDLIRSAEQTLSDLANKVPKNIPPLLMIQFMDSRHVRVFGANSLYKVATDKLGLKSAWQAETNSWGFSLVGIDALIGLDSQIVIIKPLPVGVEDKLQQDQYWQYLVNKTGRPALMLDPIWGFGAIPSMVRFAKQLNTALLTKANSQGKP
jgi:ferric hydroxamate transport system substrate-binding protein